VRRGHPLRLELPCPWWDTFSSKFIGDTSRLYDEASTRLETAEAHVHRVLEPATTPRGGLRRCWERAGPHPLHTAMPMQHHDKWTKREHLGRGETRQWIALNIHHHLGRPLGLSSPCMWWRCLRKAERDRFGGVTFVRLGRA